MSRGQPAVEESCLLVVEDHRAQDILQCPQDGGVGAPEGCARSALTRMPIPSVRSHFRTSSTGHAGRQQAAPQSDDVALDIAHGEVKAGRHWTRLPSLGSPNCASIVECDTWSTSAVGTKRTFAFIVVTSAFDPKRTWVTIASGGLHEARIYEPAMEGQNLAPRLTSEIPTLTRHHQPLAFSLRR